MVVGLARGGCGFIDPFLFSAGGGGGGVFEQHPHKSQEQSHVQAQHLQVTQLYKDSQIPGMVQQLEVSLPQHKHLSVASVVLSWCDVKNREKFLVKKDKGILNQVIPRLSSAFCARVSSTTALTAGAGFLTSFLGAGLGAAEFKRESER